MWTEELEKKASDMWLAGFSAAVIGVKLGFGRGAIMGKLFRLGVLKQRTVGTRVKMERGANPRVIVPRVVQREPARDPEEPEPKHLAFMDLESHHCRWPYGHTDYTFCGHDVAKEKRYCPYHFQKSLLPKEIP